VNAKLSLEINVLLKLQLVNIHVSDIPLSQSGFSKKEVWRNKWYRSPLCHLSSYAAFEIIGIMISQAHCKITIRKDKLTVNHAKIQSNIFSCPAFLCNELHFGGDISTRTVNRHPIYIHAQSLKHPVILTLLDWTSHNQLHYTLHWNIRNWKQFHWAVSFYWGWWMVILGFGSIQWRNTTFQKRKIMVTTAFDDGGITV
jgi:hypothetical protein